MIKFLVNLRTFICIFLAASAIVLLLAGAITFAAWVSVAVPYGPFPSMAIFVTIVAFVVCAVLAAFKTVFDQL